MISSNVYFTWKNFFSCMKILKTCQNMTRNVLIFREFCNRFYFYSICEASHQSEVRTNIRKKGQTVHWNEVIYKQRKRRTEKNTIRQIEKYSDNQRNKNGQTGKERKSTIFQKNNYLINAYLWKTKTKTYILYFF